MKSLLLAAAALVLVSTSHAGGVRRGSYGGGRRVAPASRAAQPANGYRASGAGSTSASRFFAQEEAAAGGYAPVRGRGSVGYGAVNSYRRGRAGYSRGLRGFGSGRSFGAGPRHSSIRVMGTGYAPQEGGATTGGSTPEPAPAEPVQGFAVPGALIRTAGLENHYRQPEQPSRVHTTESGGMIGEYAGTSPHMRHSEAEGPRLRAVPLDKMPTANPGWGSGGGTGGNSITALGKLKGVDDAPSGQTKPHDPSEWNDNKGGAGN